ncbi:MAG: cation:proton antiporter [Cyanobacteria bacterium P01_D01_bin.128]
MGEFWEYSAFLANSLIFLLVGLTISESPLFDQVSQTVSLLATLTITVVTVILARALVVFSLMPLLNLTGAAQVERRYQLVSFWSGLRGAVCLALALSLKADFPNRDLIVVLTLGVVLFTLLVPGTTVGWLIRLLNLDRPALIDQWRKTLAQVAAKRNVMEHIELVKEFQPQFQTVVDRFQQRCQQEVTDAEQALIEFKEQIDQQPKTLQSLVLLTALSVEKKSYQTLYGQGLMSEAVLDQLNTRTLMLQDAVLGGDFSFGGSNVVPLENRWDRYFEALIQKLIPNNSWLGYQPSRIAIARYEYWAILIRVSDIVSSKLEAFKEQGGASFIAVIQSALNLYEKKRAEAEKEMDKIATMFPELVISHQIEVSDRIARTFQNEAVIKLADEGAISDGIAAQLIQPVFSK